MKNLFLGALCLGAINIAHGSTCMDKEEKAYQEKWGLEVLLNNGYHDFDYLHARAKKCENGLVDAHRIIFRAISEEGHIVNGTVCNRNILIASTTKRFLKD